MNEKTSVSPRRSVTSNTKKTTKMAPTTAPAKLFPARDVTFWNGWDKQRA